MNYAKTTVLALILLTAVPAYALQVGVTGGSQTSVGVGDTLDVNADVSAGATGTMRSDAQTGSSSGASAEVGSVVVTRASINSNTDTTVSSAAAVSSSAELSAYASSVVKSDDNVSATSLSREAVSLAYKQRARLFGLFPVLITVTAKVEADGTIAIQYPWYSFLTTTVDASLRSSVETAIAPTASARTGGDLSASEQAQLLSELHSAMKSSLGASLTAEESASVSAR